MHCSACEVRMQRIHLDLDRDAYYCNKCGRIAPITKPKAVVAVIAGTVLAVLGLLLIL